MLLCVSGPGGVCLPNGLFVCRFCGQVGGRHRGRKSTCLCEGLTCRWCGIGRIPRPTSSSYDRRRGRFLHTPYFGGWAGCASCVVTVYGRFPTGPYSWPGPLTDDSSLKALLSTIKCAGKALAGEGEDRLPSTPGLAHSRGLWAIHGGRAAWEQLELEKPPDDRPLLVLREMPPADALDTDLSLRVASWPYARGDLPRIHREVRRRWNPPLRDVAEVTR